MGRSKSARAAGGFTLLELVLVMVILGILGAVALPKASNMTGAARYAALQTAHANLNSTLGSLAAKAALDRSGDAPIMVGDVSVPMLHGQPMGTPAFAKAAGVEAPAFVVEQQGANFMVISPPGVDTQYFNCMIMYWGKDGADPGIVPSFTMFGSVEGCE